MQSKGLIALIVVTIIVALAAIGLSLRGGGDVAEAQSGRPVFAGLAQRIGDVAMVKIVAAQGKVTLERRGGDQGPGWVVAEKGGYPADPQRVRQALLGFAELKLIEAKTRNAASFARLDVEDPGQKDGRARLVELDDAGGKKLDELIVGKRRPDRLGTDADGLYIRRPGEPQAWLAQGTVALPDDMKDWLDKKIVTIPAARIQKVTLTHADGTVLVLARDKEDGKFAAAGAPADAKFKSDSLLAEPAGALDPLELSDVRPAAEQPIPAEGAARAEWKTFDGLTLTGETIDKDGASWLRLHAEGSDDKSNKEAEILNARLAPWTYAVLAYKTNAMKTKLEDLVEAPKGS